MNDDPKKPATSNRKLSQSGCGQAARSETLPAGAGSTDFPTAYRREPDDIANVKRWLVSLGLPAKAERARSQLPATRRLAKTVAQNRVGAPQQPARPTTTVKARRQMSALPADGWVRIDCELLVAPASVEMWLRIDAFSGLIADFRIGRAPTED